MYKELLVTAILTGSSLGAWAASGAADPYPTKPIRLIVGFTPGGSDDLVGHIVLN